MNMGKVHNPMIFIDENFYPIDTNVFTMLTPGRFSVSDKGRVRDNFYNTMIDTYLFDDGNLYVILPDHYNPTSTYYFKVAALVKSTGYLVTPSRLGFNDGNKLNCSIRNVYMERCTYQDLDWTYNAKKEFNEEDIPRGYISDEDAIRVYKAMLYMNMKGDKKRGISRMFYPDLADLLKIPYNHNDPEALRALTKKFSEIKNREGRFRILLKNFPAIEE